MLQMKNNLGPISESTKAAVCLDLAATELGLGFDKASIRVRKRIEIL